MAIRCPIYARKSRKNAELHVNILMASILTIGKSTALTLKNYLAHRSDHKTAKQVINDNKEYKGHHLLQRF